MSRTGTLAGTSGQASPASSTLDGQPPRVVRGSSPAELDEAITGDEKEHAALQW
jgi:hypothetical protein